MSRQNVDIGRRMLRAFNDGDVEAIVADCDPAVEWEEQSIPGIEPLHRGHDGVRRWAAAILGVREELGPLQGRLEGVKEEQRCEGPDARPHGGHIPGRQARATPGVPDARRGPRSRGTAGVRPLTALPLPIGPQSIVDRV
jgi:SnoaL-like domain